MKGFLYRAVVKRLYTNDRVYLMECKSRLECVSPAIVRPVTYQNVNDATSFQSQAKVNTFIGFLDRGYRGYYGYLTDSCVHRSWVVTSGRVQLHKFYSKVLESKEVFVQFCETAPGARGHNIFAHVLSHIAKEFSTHRVLTAVDVNNKSSIKSMTKAGFQPVSEIHIRVVMGFKWVKSSLL